jgi:hypothetical protein
MDGVSDPRLIVIQGKLVVYPKILNEGQFAKGET